MRQPVPAHVHDRSVDEVQRKHHFAQVMRRLGVEDAVRGGEGVLRVCTGGTRKCQAEDEAGGAERGDKELFRVGGVAVWQETIDGDVDRGLWRGRR